jgi:monomeric isocitrate dehydrogenase
MTDENPQTPDNILKFANVNVSCPVLSRCWKELQVAYFHRPDWNLKEQISQNLE